MCRNQFNPRHCILPPYIGDKLADATAEKTRSVPSNVNEMASDRFREKRKAMAAMNNKKKVEISMLSDSEDEAVLSQKIFDAELLPILPGTLIWKTGDTPLPKEKDVKNAIKGVEKTWEFYKTLFNRNSINNMGMVISQSIHYRENPRKVFDNAFWDGEQMIYGEGDGEFIGSFTSDIDIIAHELTHGVIDYSAKLEYKNESGALNESFADVFGIMIKQFAEKTTAKKADWLMGKNVILGSKYALRSLKAPGTAYKNHPQLGNDPQPAVMSNFKTMKGDFGGVHYNSGIPNFAFYVTAFELGGFAWEKAGAIWYHALTEKGLLPKKATFFDMRKATLKKAAQLFGENSLEVKAVQLGWDTAEVK